MDGPIDYFQSAQVGQAKNFYRFKPRFIPNDMEFYRASFDKCGKFVRVWSPTKTPKQKFKIRFAIFSSPLIDFWNSAIFRSSYSDSYFIR